MGACGCGGSDPNDLDVYLKTNHKGKIKVESNNYELAKQDRNNEDKNLKMCKGDLDQYLRKEGRDGGPSHRESRAEGEEGDDEEIRRANDSDEEMLREMANFANKSCSNNVVKCSENGELTR